MARKLIAIALVAGSFALVACNTVRGAGKDIQSAGNAIENSTH